MCTTPYRQSPFMETTYFQKEASLTWSYHNKYHDQHNLRLMIILHMIRDDFQQNIMMISQCAQQQTFCESVWVDSFHNSPELIALILGRGNCFKIFHWSKCLHKVFEEWRNQTKENLKVGGKTLKFHPSGRPLKANDKNPRTLQDYEIFRFQ